MVVVVMVMFGALLGPEGLHVCVVSWWRVRPWWYTAPGVGVGAAGVVGLVRMLRTA